MLVWTKLKNKGKIGSETEAEGAWGLELSIGLDEYKVKDGCIN